MNPEKHQNQTQNQNERSPSDTAKINSELKKSWPKLQDNDLKLLKSSGTRQKFIETVVDKQGISRSIAEKRLKEIEASCCAPAGTKVA